MQDTFKLPDIRAGYQVNINGTTCCWFEPEHPGEGHRTLLDAFDMCFNKFQWEKYITPGSTVIDIGAHSGDTAVPMQVLANGVVLAVEPNPTIKPYAEFTCRMNSHLGKFILAGEAVTTQDGSVTILDHCNALCNGGLIDPSWTPELQKRMIDNSQNKVTVPGLTLENLCKKYLTEDEINNISFIKTDTEGHDVSIIESSKDFLNKIRPVLFIEWFFAFGDTENNHMFAVIEDLGYSAFYPDTLEPAGTHRRSDDLVLVHKSKIDQYIK
jgi:FkbM family methyltransferase